MVFPGSHIKGCPKYGFLSPFKAFLSKSTLFFRPLFCPCGHWESVPSFTQTFVAFLPRVLHFFLHPQFFNIVTPFLATRGPPLRVAPPVSLPSIDTHSDPGGFFALFLPYFPGRKFSFFYRLPSLAPPQPVYLQCLFGRCCVWSSELTILFFWRHLPHSLFGPAAMFPVVATLLTFYPWFPFHVGKTFFAYRSSPPRTPPFPPFSPCHCPLAFLGRQGPAYPNAINCGVM